MWLDQPNRLRWLGYVSEGWPLLKNPPPKKKLNTIMKMHDIIEKIIYQINDKTTAAASMLQWVVI